MATIIVSRIGFEARHGVTAPERLTTRRFEVDVEIDASVEAAEGSDRLSDTIDFCTIADVVVAIGTGEPHHLLESLARRMIDGLLARASATGIRLELRKIAPPYCAGNPASAAVRIAWP